MLRDGGRKGVPWDTVFGFCMHELPVQGQNSSMDGGEDHEAPLLAEKLLAVNG